jgi:hypothetical protein
LRINLDGTLVYNYTTNLLQKQVTAFCKKDDGAAANQLAAAPHDPRGYGY